MRPHQAGARETRAEGDTVPFVTQPSAALKGRRAAAGGTERRGDQAPGSGQGLKGPSPRPRARSAPQGGHRRGRG